MSDETEPMTSNMSITPMTPRPYRWRLTVVMLTLCPCIGVLVLTYRAIMLQVAIDACFDNRTRPYAVKNDDRVQLANGVVLRMPVLFRGHGDVLQKIGTVFANVRQIGLMQPSASNLNAVKNLHGLEELSIEGPIDAANQVHINWKAIGQPTLRAVRLQKTGIHNADFCEFLRHSSVIDLAIIDEPAIVLPGLPVLQQHSSLKRLSVVGSTHGSSSEWRELFESLSSIEFVMIDGSSVNDDVIQAMAQHRTLHELLLLETGITDRGLDFLANAEQLESLLIRGGQISREGLARLAEVKTLRKLTLTGCRLDENELDHLKQLMPKCNIQFYK